MVPSLTLTVWPTVMPSEAIVVAEPLGSRTLPVPTAAASGSRVAPVPVIFAAHRADDLATGLRLAREFGLEVVAEGIASAAHLKVLKEIGCTHGQGSLFSKAVDATRVTEMLERRPW